MEFKDYYNILDVKPESSSAEIKTAYRKLARKYHPDVSKEVAAEERFKTVNEAYEVLKDKEKRVAYDQVRAGGYHAGDSFQPPPGWGTGAAEGSTDAGFSDFFDALFGQQRRGGRIRRMRGQDVQARIKVDLSSAFHGGSTRVSLRDSSGRERVLEVKIPAGIPSGRVIRLAGQGGPGVGGGPAGDLLLEIGLRDDPRFRVQDRDLYHVLYLAPWEASLGATIKVPTLGGEVEIRIPANSAVGKKLRLRGRGLPGHPPGDQYVELAIRTPPVEGEKDRAAYAAFQAAFPGFKPR